jgi:hypothetical protein
LRFKGLEYRICVKRVKRSEIHDLEIEAFGLGIWDLVSSI